MNVNDITAKQTKEMLELIEFQEQEIKAMTARHDQERQGNSTSKYFEEKREQQKRALAIRHKIEQARLSDSHEKEYRDWRKVKTIIRESGQLEFDLKPKEKLAFDLAAKEPTQSKFERLKKLLTKIKKRGRSYEP